MLEFPHPFEPDVTTRAGRMMLAGRAKVTVTSGTSRQHITILLKSFADNRQRQYDQTKQKNWIECPLVDATHLFAEVPNPSGWNDKVGTYYPTTGRWYDADNADPARVWAAKVIGHWLISQFQAMTTFGASFQEASECGRCGHTLTDPVSIERGIGPECYGMVTGSQHQIKAQSQSQPLPQAQVEPKVSYVEHCENILNISVRNLKPEELELLKLAIAEEVTLRNQQESWEDFINPEDREEGDPEDNDSSFLAR